MSPCLLLLAFQCALGAAVALPAGSIAPLAPTPAMAAGVTATAALDTPRARPKAIEYSDWYAKRLAVHRIGSYVMFPLFAGEYVLGDRLLNGTDVPGWVKPAHAATAGAIATVFTVNTVTGLWNLYDSRMDPNGRSRRILHTGLMLASDAGFVLTGLMADDANEDAGAGQRHRNVAIGSMALSSAGTLLMWLWKD